MHLESIEKKTGSFVNLAEQLIISVRSAVNSSVRNEIHMKRIEDRVLSIEAKVEEAVNSGKEAIDLYKQSYLLTEERYSSLKSTLDSVIKEMKSAGKVKTTDTVEKTWVQNFDEALQNFDKVMEFPDRVMEQVERIVRYAAALEFLLLWIGSPTHQEMKRVTWNLEELKETCHDISLIDGTYSEIGKKASDLLYQYYVSGVTAILSADASDGAVFNLSMENKLLADLTFVSKATLDDNLMEFTLNFQDLYNPFVKGSLSAPLPWRTAEGHIHLLHDFGAVDAKVDLTTSPILNLSCLFGVKAFSIGGDFAVNTSGVFSKFDAGLGITYNGFCASFKIQEQCQKFSASLFGKLSENVSFALEYVHDQSPEKEEAKKKIKEKHRLVAGISGKVNPSTTLKARVDTAYLAAAAVEYRWRPKSSVALSIEVDMKKKTEMPKMGLSVEFGLKSR